MHSPFEVDLKPFFLISFIDFFCIENDLHDLFSQFYYIRKNEYLTNPLLLLQPYRAYARYGQAIPRPEGRQYSYASMADMDWGWKKR